MDVEFSLNELKEELGAKKYDYVDIVIIDTQHWGLEVRACPTNPLLRSVIDTIYLGSIPVEKISDEKYRTKWYNVNKIIAKKRVVEKLNYRCQRLIQKLKELAYSDDE